MSGTTTDHAVIHAREVGPGDTVAIVDERGLIRRANRVDLDAGDYVDVTVLRRVRNVLTVDHGGSRRALPSYLNVMIRPR